MNSLDITIWMEERAYKAMEAKLPEGTTIEMEAERLLHQLYEQLVPEEERKQIVELLAHEEREAVTAGLASRRFTLFQIVKDGDECCRISEAYRTPLEVAYRCALQYKDAGRMSCEAFAEAAYPKSRSIMKEEFVDRCKQDGNRILAAYRLDFDENTMSVSMGNTVTEPLDVVVKASRIAYRHPSLNFEEQTRLFAMKIEELTMPVELEDGQMEQPGHMTPSM